MSRSVCVNHLALPFVTEPTGRQVWYGDKGPTETGGFLDRDDNVGVCGSDAEAGGVENTVWGDSSTPAHGTYTVDINRYSSCGSAEQWTLEARIDGEVVASKSGSEMTHSPSPTDTETPTAPRVAWWGWLGLLAVPAWLLWITGIGYSMKKVCIEGDVQTPAAATAAEREACSATPAAWAPFRGVEFGGRDATGELWLIGLVLALLLLVGVFWAARRSVRAHL